MDASDFQPGDVVRSRVNGMLGVVVRASNKLNVVEVEWRMAKRRRTDVIEPARVSPECLAHVRGAQRRSRSD